MRLVQFKKDEERRVALVGEDDSLLIVESARSTYDLALDAIKSGKTLGEIVRSRLSKERFDYDEILSKKLILPPIDHPDPSHLLVTGTGLDHLGSAVARDAMHNVDSNKLTDSMKMFNIGLEGGKPNKGEIGSQPEWFYKGDGSCIVPPEGTLDVPPFALDGGEEAEIVGIYIIADCAQVFRVGFALGNEFSDHVLEKENYLYLAHSKLRQCSIGPELLLGELPDSVTCTVKVLRNAREIWSSSFLTGEKNMVHSIANLEHHHFKYDQFRRPGDVHCHFFGAAVLSFSSGVKTEPGDVFEISSPVFGRPLRNSVVVEPKSQGPISVKTL